MTIEAVRYHDFSAGHRVCGHESKCAYLHGHNYRVTYHCQGALDAVGRVLDFGVIKERLCQWLEIHWDHRFLIWEGDKTLEGLSHAHSLGVVRVPFNPTAENMADYLLRTIAPLVLTGTGVTCTKVIVEETRKCSASSSIILG